MVATEDDQDDKMADGATTTRNWNNATGNIVSSARWPHPGSRLKLREHVLKLVQVRT